MLLSLPDIRDLGATQTSFEQMTIWRRTRIGLTTDRTSVSLFAEVVAGNYFEFVGAQPRVGRLLQPADDLPAAASVVVVSEHFWRRYLQADPNVVGRVISLNSVPAEIVGVVALPFLGVDMPNVVPTPVWVSMAFAQRIERDRNADEIDSRESRWWLVKARLRPGVSAAQARAQVVAVGRQLDRAYPLGTAGDRARGYPPSISRPWHLVPAASILVHESVDRLASPVAAAVVVMIVLVLLVTCTNIANLLLARGIARQSEFAIRYALGASRWRIVREQLAESVLLATASGVAAIVTARWAVVQIASTSAIQLGPAVMQLTPAADSTVAAAACVSTAIALAVFGVVPALHVTRRAPNPSLSSNDVTSSARRWRGRRALIAAQVAVSVALVAAAMLSAQQVIRSVQQDTGLDLDDFAAASIDFRLANYAEPRAREALRRIIDTVRSEPHSERVALSSGLPLGIFAPSALVSAPGEALEPGGAGVHYPKLLAATPEIFDAIGVRATSGRLLDDRDSASAARVAVISEQLAKSVFGTVDVVGRQLAFRRLQQASDIARPLTLTIIGVVEDTDVNSAGRRTDPVVYVPFEQHYESRMAVVVRSSDPSQTIAALPELIRRADPGIAVSDIGTGVSLSGAANVPLRITAGLTGLLGAVALLLAMTGLYGVLSYVVAGRRREIGVRRALGATTSIVLRMVLADGLRPVAIGLFVGLSLGGALRLAAGRALRSVPTVDPWLMLLVPLLFVLAGLFACCMPARRAIQVDPSVALRDL
jgi:predicted permease